MSNADAEKIAELESNLHTELMDLIAQIKVRHLILLKLNKKLEKVFLDERAVYALKPKE